jgi:histidinol-phosphate aminotransferase
MTSGAIIRPQPGILDIALYEGGKAHVAGVSNVVKLSSNENPFGPSDKAKEAFQRAVHKPAPLSRHRPCRACAPRLPRCMGWTPGASSAARVRTRSSPSSARPMPGRGRGGVHRTRLPDVSHLGAGGRGDPGRGAGARPHDGCRCDPCRLQPAHEAGVHRQPEQPDRHDDRRPRSSGWPMACRRRRFWCWTGPMPNMSKATTAARLVDARANVVMTRTFSKIYGLGGPCGSAGAMGRSMIIDVLNRIRGPFNLSTRSLRPPRPPCAIRTCRQVPRRKHPDAAWLAECAGRKGRALGHVDGELHPGPLCQPGRGRGLRCLPAGAGPDRAAGGGLQAAALPAHHHRATRPRAARSPMPSAQFKGVK